MPGSRAQLRQHFKAKRQALSDSYRQAAHLRITNTLTRLSYLRETQVVAAFLATPAEVDLSIWYQRFWAQGGQTVLPVVADSGDMDFYPYAADTALHPNRFNIAEPTRAAKVPPRDIDVMLLPLVAFDDAGNRLGMGGGYYDRYIARIKKAVPLIGIAYDCQRAAGPLPRADWDMPMHTVVTESGVLEFPQT